MVSRQTTNDLVSARRYPIGVEIICSNDGSAVAHARVWAPNRTSVELVIVDDPGAPTDSKIIPQGDGYFSGAVANVGHGTRYKFRLDGGDAFPDPASRYQPEGPHGPSMVVDPTTYEWSDQDWRGISLEGQVIYEGAIDDTPSARVEDLKTARNYVAAALNDVKAGRKVAVAYSQPYGCSVKYKDA